jgi:hypothetical protein
MLLMSSAVVHADMSECSKTNIQDDKNYCMAKYAGSATFCDKIKSYERRTQCIRLVIEKQRQSRYSTIQPKEEK